VLFEMLTGRPTFETGETVSDAVAAILTKEPDWKALPTQVPEPIRRLLRRCLEKDPDRRLHHIADARLEIADAMSASSTDEALATRQVRPVWTRVLPWALTAVALSVAAFVLWASNGSRSSDTSPVRRLELALPPSVELFTGSQTVAVTPDGARIAFVGVRAGVREVYIRALDQLSPDGRWLTYVSDESGHSEIYLRPFPEPDRRWPISTQGGTQPIWSPTEKRSSTAMATR
jgi:serine/threonine-protein kinase